VNVPIVSVIIPCYNQGQYLSESIGSVLASGFDDLEIIVIDDGSDDQETKKILDCINYPKTRLIRQNNSGPSAARNRAIVDSQGVFILPLDADDRIGPRYIGQAVAALEADENLGIVYCLGEKFGAQQGPINAVTFSLSRMRFSNLIFSAALFRRDDWRHVGGYDEQMVYGNEDWEFWMSVIELGRGVLRLPEVGFWYRIKSESRNLSMNLQRRLDMHRRIIHNHPALFPWWFNLILGSYYRIISTAIYRTVKRSGLLGKVLS
jgi:glycosyltransferase involved in cell wall biosynthesis